MRKTFVSRDRASVMPRLKVAPQVLLPLFLITTRLLRRPMRAPWRLPGPG